MEFTILEIMQKGKRSIARIQAVEGKDTTIVGVELTEQMTKDDVYNKAQELATAKIERFKNPPAKLEIPVVVVDINNLRTELIAEINKKITK